MSDNPNPFGTAPKAEPAAEPKVKQAVKELHKSSSKPTVELANQPTPATFGKPTSTSKKSHKGLIIGSSIGVVAVIAIVVGALLFVNLNKVTAKDYEEAMDAMADTSKSSYDVTSEFSYSDIIDGDEDDLNDLIDKANQAIDEGQKKINKLGQMKAIQKDEDAKSKFDVMNKDYAKFTDEAKQTFDTIKGAMPVYQVMNDANELDSSYGDDSYYTDRSKAYQAVADKAKAVKISDSKVSEAMQDITAAAQSYADYYTKLGNGDKVNYSEVSSVSRKFSSASSKITDAFDSNELNDAASKFTRSANKLSDYLSNKYYDARR